jgi:hypothetical protein
LRQTEIIGAPDQLYAELWVSLASLLRSYTAAHGLSGGREAIVEADENRITVHASNKWLHLDRDGPLIRWRREDGRNCIRELTDGGKIKSSENWQEMDMAAEEWARELMH